MLLICVIQVGGESTYEFGGAPGVVLKFLEINALDYGYYAEDGLKFDYDGMFFLLFRIRVRVCVLEIPNSS